MYLHLGQDVLVSSKNVIGIFDIENTTISKITREFLKEAQEEEFIVNISDDLPKSFVICEIDKKSRIFISPISAATLLKRTNYLQKISLR